MKISKYEIKPLLLYLPDEQVWVDRWNACKQHLEEQGITDYYSVAGIHGEKFGIAGTHYFELDNPGGKHMIGQKYTASFLSQYVMYSVANAMDYTHYLFIEDDTRFTEGWREKLQICLDLIPEDFDFLFVGSCCTEGKLKIDIGSGLYKYPQTNGYPARYPMGGNCYIISKKCLNHIIATQRDAYAPADINLAMHSFSEMEVYAILPRLVEQLGNEKLPA